jgi:sulfonate transport system permease protein
MSDVPQAQGVIGGPGPFAREPRGGAPTATSASVIARRPGAAELRPRSHQRNRRVRELVLGIVFPLALLSLWQAASTRGWIDERFYPRPTDVVRSGWELWQDGLLWDSIWATSKSCVVGFLYGSFIGLVLGFSMGASRTIRATMEPTLNALYTVPKTALLGVMIAIFGLNNTAKIALVTITVFFFVWIATMSAVMSVPEGFREAAQSLGASRWHMFRHVLLPAALPQVFVGLRIAAGVTILVIVSIEGILASSNEPTVGQLIFGSRLLFRYDQMFVGIVIAALLGVVFTLLVRWVGRLLTPWAPEDRSVAAR